MTNILLSNPLSKGARLRNLVTVLISSGFAAEVFSSNNFNSINYITPVSNTAEMTSTT